MNPQLQGLEVETARAGDDDFAVEDASIRQLRAQRVEQFGKVSIQGFLVAALQQDLLAVAKHQRAKAIPLGFEDPG